MKKILTMILLSITMMASYSQTDTSSLADKISIGIDNIENKIDGVLVDIDTNSLYSSMYDDVKIGIAAMADALKTSVEFVLTIIIKKYILEGILSLIYVFLSLLSLYALWKFFDKIKELDEYDKFPIIMLYVIYGIFSVFIIGLITIPNLHDGIMYTFNPEYYMLRDVVEMVKSLKQ